MRATGGKTITMLRIRTTLLILLALLCAPATALAHGGHLSSVQTFTQQIGPYELGVTVEMPPSVPAPLYLNLNPQGDFGNATIAVQAVPRGFPLDGATPAIVQTVAGVQVYYTELAIDRAGDWDLYVRVDGDRGHGLARIPLTIVLPEAPAGTIALIVALGCMVALMLANISLAAIARQRGSSIPAVIDRALGYAIFACIIAAVIFGFQQFGAQFSGANASAATTAPSTSSSALSAQGGLPHANAELATDPALPQAGQPFTLTLDLTDGSTGLPIDDLIPHHDALIHLVLIDESSQAFAHIHPAGVAPGRYAVATTLEQPGDYTAYIEIERQASGTQVIARRFQVGGGPSTATAPAADIPGLGARTIDGLSIDVSASQPPRAGRQTTLTLHVSAGGQPVTDIAPWLGMAGHLIARSADGQVFGHIHAVGAMLTGTVDTSVAPPVFGPDIQFVYTFPSAGRYYLWAQFQYQHAIVTVPIALDVAAE
jgi:hypothetical protein